MNYNKYIDRISTTTKSYISSTVSDQSYILPIDQTNHQHTGNTFQQTDSILNDIIRHPFIDTLPMDINSLPESFCPSNIVKYRVVLYRIQHHNDNHYVEFYLPFDTSYNSRLTIEYRNTMEITEKLLSNDTIIKYLKEHIREIPGIKRLKGHLVHNNILYSIVQVRDKNSTNNSIMNQSNTSYYNNNTWLTIWDIIAYKNVFREKIDNSIVELFIRHHNIAHLFINKQICLLPMTLYCNVPNKHESFINKNKSVQYCQRENSPIIQLNCDYLCESNNVRNVCFILDSDIVSSKDTLQHQSYIITNNPNHNHNHSDLTYLFKNDNNIISYIK